MAVGPVGGRAHGEEGDLPDLHAGIQADRQVGDIGQFQRDVAGEAGVNISCRGVDDQSQPPKRAFAFQARHQVVSQSDTRSTVLPSMNSPGWTIKLFVLTDMDQFRQFVLRHRGSMQEYL